jgi:uncharacterized protein YjbI with pentapeptide repeats
LGQVQNFAVIAAAFLYLFDVIDRRKQVERQAWQLIDGARGAETSGGRRQAIEDLYEEDKENLLEGLDVDGADLIKINLSEANLERGNFKGTDLRGVNFKGAKLKLAHFQGAKLNGADFSGFSENKTDLWGANFEGADFYTVPIGSETEDNEIKKTNFKNAVL